MSVTRQIEDAKADATWKGWTDADEHIYSGDGMSGPEFTRRPGFLRLMIALGCDMGRCEETQEIPPGGSAAVGGKGWPWRRLDDNAYHPARGAPPPPATLGEQAKSVQ